MLMELVGDILLNEAFFWLQKREGLRQTMKMGKCAFQKAGFDYIRQREVREKRRWSGLQMGMRWMESKNGEARRKMGRTHNSNSIERMVEASSYNVIRKVMGNRGLSIVLREDNCCVEEDSVYLDLKT